MGWLNNIGRVALGVSTGGLSEVARAGNNAVSSTGTPYVAEPENPRGGLYQDENGQWFVQGMQNQGSRRVDPTFNAGSFLDYSTLNQPNAPTGFSYNAPTTLATEQGKNIFQLDDRYYYQDNNGKPIEITPEQVKNLAQQDYNRNLYDYNYNQALNEMTKFNTGLDDKYEAINKEAAGAQGFDPEFRKSMEMNMKRGNAGAYNEMSRLAQEELARRGISGSGIADKSALDLSKSYMDNINQGMKSIDLDDLSMKKAAETELYNRRLGELGGTLSGLQNNYGAFGDYAKYNKGLYNEALNRQQSIQDQQKQRDLDYKKWQEEMNYKRSLNQGGGWKGALGGIVGAGLGSLVGGAGTAIGSQVGQYVGNSLGNSGGYTPTYQSYNQRNMYAAK